MHGLLGEDSRPSHFNLPYLTLSRLTDNSKALHCCLFVFCCSFHKGKAGMQPPTPNDSRVFHILGNHGSPQSGAQRMGLTRQNHLGDRSSFICQVGTHCHRHLDGLHESCPGQASICHSHDCSAEAVAWQPGTPRSLTSQPGAGLATAAQGSDGPWPRHCTALPVTDGRLSQPPIHVLHSAS